MARREWCGSEGSFGRGGGCFAGAPLEAPAGMGALVEGGRAGGGCAGGGSERASAGVLFRPAHAQGAGERDLTRGCGMRCTFTGFFFGGLMMKV
eukprot:1181956-Prorocentrum_minimum.AAC.7